MILIAFVFQVVIAIGSGVIALSFHRMAARMAIAANDRRFLVISLETLFVLTSASRLCGAIDLYFPVDYLNTIVLAALAGAMVMNAYMFPRTMRAMLDKEAVSNGGP